MLHRLSGPVIYWRHFLPRQENVHVVVTLLRRRFRRSRFDLRNHRLIDGIVPTSSRGGRRTGHPGGLTLGALSETTCGLLLLLPGTLAAASGHGRLSPPYPFGFGRSPTAYALACHRQKTPCRTDGFALFSHRQPWHSRVSGARQQHFTTAWSPPQPPTWRHAVFAVCRRAASLASTTAWSRCCLAIMLNTSGPCVRYRNVSSFHLAPELERLDSRRYCLYQHPSMIQRVLPTVGLHHLREPAVSKAFPQVTFLHEQLAIHRHARIHLQHTDYLAAEILITRLLHINASKPFEPCISSFSEMSTQGLTSSSNSSATIIRVAAPTSPLFLASTRSPTSWFVIYICCWYSEQATRNSCISLKVTTSPPNLGGLSPPIVILISGFGRPSPQRLPLGLSQLAEWIPPAPYARAIPAVVRSPIAFVWGSTPSRKTVRSASEKKLCHIWGRKQNLPNSIELYRLATDGPGISAPKTSPRTPGVRLFRMQ